ncbi:MAG: hypothetical protein EOP84_16740, partial [Verrucomicrobiaceae bacterium]
MCPANKALSLSKRFIFALPVRVRLDKRVIEVFPLSLPAARAVSPYVDARGTKVGQDQIIGANGRPGSGIRSNDNDAVTMPLTVDLDGTLLLTDTLFEALAEHLRRRPLWALWQLLQLPFSIAKVKDRLTKSVDVDVDSLPVNEDVLAYCKRAKASGREVWLVSAADQKMVDRVAARFGIFDRAIGSDGTTNNKGSAKARLLTREAPAGFEYVGDSPADYKVWKHAARCSYVGKGESRRKAIERMGVQVA